MAVLNATNFTVQWSVNNWVTINFTTPFIYNGTNNLVVQIQKVYDRVTNPIPGVVTHQTTGSPHRTDLVPAKYSFSALGGGGSTTDVVSFSGSVLSMRLLCDAQGTATVRSVSQPTGSEFAIGTNAEYTIWAITGTPWAAFLDTGLQSPISFPFFQGRLYVVPSLMIGNGVTTANSSSLTLPLPNVRTIIGSYFTLQAATVSPATLSIGMTNVVDFFITG